MLCRATTRLTDRSVRALPAPAKGAVITYDADLPGFGIRITARDVRSFVLNYVVHGRERRMTIGRFRPGRQRRPGKRRKSCVAKSKQRSILWTSRRRKRRRRRLPE